MLRSLKDLEHYRVQAEDGEIGSVTDFYFDDERWTIRYLVTNAGTYFNEREVLISPIAFGDADWATSQFNVALSREKVRSSPGIDLHQPVSRQREREYYRFYGWPEYWTFNTPWSWGVGPVPGMLAGHPLPAEQPPITGDDPHLRSARLVGRYHVMGIDGEIGHVCDFVVDDQSWQIRYLVVDTSHWWMGKKVLVAPAWADRISFDDSTVFLGLSRERIRDCPLWDPTAPVNREYEARLYDYYGRPIYWQTPTAAAESFPSV